MKLSLPFSVLISAGTLGLVDQVGHGQTCNDPIPLVGDTVRIGPNTAASFDEYGTSVGISGDWAIGGAIELGNASRGFAIVHYRHQGGLDNWGEVKRLTSPDSFADQAGDEFGVSSAISGDYLIVGSHKDNANGISNAGSAYIFERNTGGQNNWGLAATLTASDGALGDTFGAAVAISGDLAIVSSPFDDDNGADSGSVYIFRRDGNGNWNFEVKFSGEAAGDNYGASVDIAYDALWDKHLAVVGSPFHDFEHQDDSASGSSTLNTGAAYVLRYDPDLLIPAWPTQQQQEKFVAPDTPTHCLPPVPPFFEEIFEDAFFGNDIACWRSPSADTSGDLVAVSAFEHHLEGKVCGSDPLIECLVVAELDPNHTYGAAYVFRRDNATSWDDGFTLLPVECDDGGHFGRAIDIEDTRVIVSSSLLMQNVVHLFEFQQLGLVEEWDEKLILDDFSFSGGGANSLGNAVALSGGTMVAGAFDEFTSSPPAPPLTGIGSVYVYNGMNDCDGNGVIDALEICSIPSLDCTGNDILDECEVLGCMGDIVPIACGGNGIVNIDDLVGVLNAFGPCPAPPAACPEDITPEPNGNGVVNIDDLVAVLNAFGDICAEVGASSSGASGTLSVVKMNFSNGWVDAGGQLADPASNGLISAAWVNIDQNWDVYRLFANVNDALSTLTYAGGGLSSGPGGVSEPLVLNPGKGAQFYIPIAGSYAPPNVALFSMTGDPNFQLAAFGTYLSFGMAGGSSPVAMGNVNSLDGLLTGFVNAADAGWGVYGAVAGQGVVSDGNGGWRVLIGQFAVPKGKTFTAAVRLAGDGIDVYATVNSGVTTLP